MYIIMRGNRFLAPSGSHDMFTPYLQNAQIFRHREAAEKECCENERVISLESLLYIKE